MATCLRHPDVSYNHEFVSLIATLIYLFPNTHRHVYVPRDARPLLSPAPPFTIISPHHILWHQGPMSAHYSFERARIPYNIVSPNLTSFAPLPTSTTYARVAY